MQILEIKNNIATIAYNPSENNLLLSDFLLIEDVNQKLISQVLEIESTDDVDTNIATLRLALNIDQDDNLIYYNGHFPSRKSKIIYITPDEIIELIKSNKDDLYFGKLSNHKSCFVKASSSFIDDGLCVFSDKPINIITIFNNLMTELSEREQKSVVIDFSGEFSNLPDTYKIKISNDVKLPLNIDAFDNILKYDVEGCPIEDVAVVQSIVLDLREYLKTLSDEYIPFNVFNNVVANEYASNPSSGLLLLKNKLGLYAQNGFFADNNNQLKLLNTILLNQNVIVIDASDVDANWHKFVVQTISKLINYKCYLFLSLNGASLDKRYLQDLYKKSKIIPVVASNYDGDYTSTIKSLCKNYLLSKPMKSFEENEYYTILLNHINSDEMIMYGETTLYLPLQLELKVFETQLQDNIVTNDIVKDVDKFLSSPQTVIPSGATIIEEFDFEKEDIEEIVEEPSEQLKELDNDIDDLTDSDFDFLDEIDTPKKNENYNNDDDDILNVPFSLNQREDIPQISKDVSYGVFEPVANSKNSGDVNAVNVSPQHSGRIEKIMMNEEPEVSEVVENKLPQENTETVEKEEIIEEIVEENISENSNAEEIFFENSEEENTNEEDVQSSVLDEVVDVIEEKAKNQAQNQQVEDDKDFVVELETDDDVVEESKPPEINEKISDISSKDVPVYETDTAVSQEQGELPFKIGDRVYHPKHGKGVIEGFANYSNKILFCQIDFDNVGRRILDPRISGIEKIAK
ncbi:MAG: hypothetical protein E7Z90_00355 [Cyanobacteria bacterium SIG29]|nr:hypothetical protein [Cyanobacteria bacterium SIG29]